MNMLLFILAVFVALLAMGTFAFGYTFEKNDMMNWQRS